MSKADAEAILQLDGSDAANGLVITDGTNADAINLPGDHTIKTAGMFRTTAVAARVAHDPPVSATGEDTSAQSTSADNHFSVSSPFTATLSGNGDHSASPFKPNLDHHATVIRKSTDSSPRTTCCSILPITCFICPRSLPTTDHGADPAHPHVDGNQSASFKFADDGSAHPGAVPSDAPL